MSNQLYKEGDVIGEGANALECIMVNYRERDGKRENFVYSFRAHSDMETERKETTVPEITDGMEQLSITDQLEGEDKSND